jgi:hypothetical protein
LEIGKTGHHNGHKGTQRRSFILSFVVKSQGLLKVAVALRNFRQRGNANFANKRMSRITPFFCAHEPRSVLHEMLPLDLQSSEGTGGLQIRRERFVIY